MAGSLTPPSPNCDFSSPLEAPDFSGNLKKFTDFEQDLTRKSHKIHDFTNCFSKQYC